MSILNPHSVYQITKPTRIDPKFIGIGQVYMQHKHKRKQFQKIYRSTKNHLLFTQKTHLQLDKSLEDKQKQLQRLQQIRQRHQKDIQNKMKSQEQRRIKLQQLRRKTTFERRKLKSSIQQRMSSLKQERKRDKNELKNKSKQLRDQLSTSQNQRFHLRKTMYKTISSQKQRGNKKVDEFYKQKILLSLTQYNNKIKQEDQKSLFFQQSISKMNQTISLINQTNFKKQKRLLKIQQKIQKLNPLKSFFSTKLTNNLNEITMSRKSSLKSFSSKKPSQIILQNQFEEGSPKREKINYHKKMKINREDNPESPDEYEVDA